MKKTRKSTPQQYPVPGVPLEQGTVAFYINLEWYTFGLKYWYTFGLK
jgi:hypothetical protein